jgi:alanyl-tRNA synthetase
MAEEQGLGIDQPGFETAQAKSKEASKAGVKKSDKNAVRLDVHDIAALEKNPEVPKTEDEPKFSE